MVFDRVPAAGGGPRKLPDPLDAAFAALGNDAALPLLQEELDTYAYAPQLARIRRLVDAHGDDYWQESLYTDWLSALRAVSPASALAGEEGLPSVAKTEPWARRVLNTQLASWAELRHDTILYVKQSYSSGIACEFPDGYVDSYPEAFGALARYAQRGNQVAALFAGRDPSELAARIDIYFNELGTVAATLQAMAEQQKSGVPFDEEQMAFPNDAVRSQVEGCGWPTTYHGWYGRLLFNRSEDEMDPVIADVHTFPGGAIPPEVLHVATGLPRLMVMTRESCDGPRAYAGVVSSYHEVVTGLDRLTDEEWALMATNARFVDWMTSILPQDVR